MTAPDGTHRLHGTAPIPLPTHGPGDGHWFALCAIEHDDEILIELVEILAWSHGLPLTRDVDGGTDLRERVLLAHHIMNGDEDLEEADRLLRKFAAFRLRERNDTRHAFHHHQPQRTT
jgi:hypothetical protein